MIEESYSATLSLTDTQRIIMKSVAKEHLRQWNAYQEDSNFTSIDLQVLRAAAELQLAIMEQSKLPSWHRLFRTNTRKSAQNKIEEKFAELTDLVDQGPKYRKSYNKILGLDIGENGK